MNTTSIIIDKERQPPWASPGAVVFSCNDEIVGPGGQHDWWQLCQHGWPLYLGGYSAIILLDKLEFDGGKEMFEELGISFGTALIVLIALYFVVKWAVKNGIKEAYKDITWKDTAEDIEADEEEN